MYWLLFPCQLHYNNIIFRKHKKWLTETHFYTKISYIFGAWLSLVERFLGVEEVASSNLVAPTN